MFTSFLSELLKEDIEIDEILESEANQDTKNDKYNKVDGSTGKVFNLLPVTTRVSNIGGSSGSSSSSLCGTMSFLSPEGNGFGNVFIPFLIISNTRKSSGR